MTQDDAADMELDTAHDCPPDYPLIFGRVLDGHGGGREVTWEEARAWLPGTDHEVLWVHLCRDGNEVNDWLTQLHIPEPTRELLLSDEHRPRAFREGDTLVATLRGINFNPGAEPEDMLAMQLWCDGRRLITLRHKPLQTPRQVLRMIDRRELGPSDCGALITDLTESMIAHMNHAIVDMNDHITELECGDPDKDTEATLLKIASIRRNCLGLKRHMGPMHEALEAISRQTLPWFEQHDRREIHESIERLKRYLDDLDISKESALVLQDDIRARSVARNERTTFLLTIVASIFMPLTFFTGLLGSNVAGIPYADHAEAFWWVVAICAAIMLVQVVLFLRWKWL